MIFTRRVLVLVGIVFFLSLNVFAASSLDKTQWQVEITQEGATIPQHIDRLRFQDGTFSSVIFGRKGFLSSPYTLTENAGSPATWESKALSETDGALVWHGEIKDNVMTGTLVATQPDGIVTTYALKGSPAVEEAPASEASAKAGAAAKKGSWWGCSLKY